MIRGAGVMAAAVALWAGGAAAAGGVDGLWNTPIDGGSVIRLGPCGANLCGWVATSPHLRANPDQRDVRNRDPAQRGRVLHDLLVFEVHRISADKWADGWAYNPEDGGTYKGRMERSADGVLHVTGCIVYPLCKTETWTRAN